MTRSLDWFLVGVLLLTTIFYVYVTAKSSSAPRGAPALSPGSARLAATQRMDLSRIAPMVWDDLEGAYMVTLMVGAGAVQLVLDTGSSQLSVKGAGCQWRSCTQAGGCSVTACPCGLNDDGSARSDCSEHYYQPSGPRLAPGEAGAGTSTQMTYGSQTDTVQHYLDTIRVPQLSSALTCPMLTRAPSIRELGAPAVLNDEIGVDLVVHRVSHIEGTSSSNLLGLARPNGGSVEHGRDVVLDKLLDKQQVWSTLLFPEGGWLALGPLPCFPGHEMPMERPAAFSNFLTSFYIVKVVGIQVGPSWSALARVKNAPKFCVIDTGTTATYGSPALGAGMAAAGYVENQSVMRLQLGTGSSPVTLDYSAEQLRDPDYPGQSVLEVLPGRTLDDYTQIFPDRDGGTLLLGAVMMRGCCWKFDLKRRKIGVADLR